jgi:hypothetical protein
MIVDPATGRPVSPSALGASPKQAMSAPVTQPGRAARDGSDGARTPRTDPPLPPAAETCSAGPSKAAVDGLPCLPSIRTALQTSSAMASDDRAGQPPLACHSGSFSDFMHAATSTVCGDTPQVDVLLATDSGSSPFAATADQKEQASSQHMRCQSGTAHDDPIADSGDAPAPQLGELSLTPAPELAQYTHLTAAPTPSLATAWTAEPSASAQTGSILPSSRQDTAAEEAPVSPEAEQAEADDSRPDSSVHLPIPRLDAPAGTAPRQALVRAHPRSAQQRLRSDETSVAH